MKGTYAFAILCCAILAVMVTMAMADPDPNASPDPAPLPLPGGSKAKYHYHKHKHYHKHVHKHKHGHKHKKGGKSSSSSSSGYRRRLGEEDPKKLESGRRNIFADPNARSVLPASVAMPYYNANPTAQAQALLLSQYLSGGSAYLPRTY